MNFAPVTTLEELDSLDDADILEGYTSAERGDPEPGPNRGKSFWFGWCNRQRDYGVIQSDEGHRLLVKQFMARQRLNQQGNETAKSNLSLAISIATEAHDGQVDKGGAPYILHPLRVMMAVNGTCERIVAVLHDVAEDCPKWPLERLKAAPFSGTVCDALDALTRREGEDYWTFIDRCAAHPVARIVKMADLKDNQDLSRIKNPTEKDCDRIRKYVKASMILLSHEPELH